ALSPDRRHLAVGYDRELRIWDLTDGRPVRTLTGHTGPISHVRYSPDGKVVASAGEDGTARLWDASDGRELRVFKTGEKPGCPADVVFNPDGTLVAASCNSGTITVWEAATGRERGRFWGFGVALAIAFSPDGRHIAGGFIGHDAIRVYDLATGK